MRQRLKALMADQKIENGDDGLKDIVEQMSSSDDLTVLHATQAIKKMSQEKNPPIEKLINNDVVPFCVRFLDSKIPELPFEAALILTNIASGTSEQTKKVVEAGAVPKLVKLLESNESAAAEQSAWALGNIAGDGSIARDVVLDSGVVEAIVKLLQKVQPILFLRNIVWLMSNLCRNKDPRPSFSKVQAMLPALAKLLRNDDIQILSNAAWAIAYASDDDEDGDNRRIDAVIKAGCVPSLIRLLDRDENDIIVPALRGIRSIVSGSDAHVDVALEAGLLKYLKKFLRDSTSSRVEKVVFTISNITVGNAQHIQAVIDAGIFEDIRNVMTYGDIGAKNEAAFALRNTSDSGTPEQILYLFQRVGILEPFCDLIHLNDEQTSSMVKDGLYDFIKIAGTDIFKHTINENCVTELSDKVEEIKLSEYIEDEEW